MSCLRFNIGGVASGIENKNNKKGGLPMNKAFLYSRTEATVTPDSSTSQGIRTSVELAYDRTVIVTAGYSTGAGAIIGDKIVTSLLLVANMQDVFVRFHQGKKMRAFVTRRDHGMNLAELVPACRCLSTESRKEPLVSTSSPRIGKIGAIGDPLLVTDVGNGVPSVKVAGTQYVTILDELHCDLFRIKPLAPHGLIGGSIWNTDGKFMGVAIGEKIPSPYDRVDDSKDRSVYFLPGEEVMNFVESSN